MKIGILDSGVGGLSILAALENRLTGGEIVYLADSAFFPYGKKSREEIVERTQRCCEALMQRGVSLIVLACHTASAQLSDKMSFPLIGMVDISLRELKNDEREGPLLLFATEATIDSGTYQERLKQLMPERRLFSLPGPYFVEAAEKGKFQREEVERAADTLFRPMQTESKGQLFLACTHFSFIRGPLSQALREGWHLFDPAEAVAREVVRRLPSSDQPLTVKLYATAEPELFQRRASQLLGREVKVDLLEA